MNRAFTALVFILSFSQLFAQTGGGSTYNFLDLSIPARVASMGGTFISAKDNDLNLTFQNPSLLDTTMNNSFSASYIKYFADINYGYSAYAHSFRKVGTFSAGIQFLDYGKFTSATTTGEITGQFTSAEYAFNIGYARPIDSTFSIGATLKTIYSKLDQFTSYGNALDLGVVYNNSRRLFSVGLVAKNMGRQWKAYNLVREPLPFEVQLGVSKKLRHAPFRFTLTFIHLEKWDLTYTDPLLVKVDPITGQKIESSNLGRFGDKLGRHILIGGEILLTRSFNICLGYNYLRRQELKLESHPGLAGFSFGFGIRIYKFHMSYGYAKYHAGGGPNHITLTVNFSDFYSKKS